MLTYDDLDHFDERTMAGLFDPAVAVQERAEAQRRRERILACLRFCRDIPSGQLSADGMQTARRLLRRALRRQHREPRPAPDGMADFLAGALAALGDAMERPEESIETAALRHAVEREMEIAAQARASAGTVVPDVLEALARGDFEISADSDVAALEEASRRFNASAGVDIRLHLDGGGFPAGAETSIRLTIACGLWRWTAQPGCSIALGGGDPVALAQDDELLPVMLAGLAVQGGRAISLWAGAVRAAAGDGAGRALN